MRARRASPGGHYECVRACARLRAAIPDPAAADPATFPSLVIEALRGMGADAWILLDERYGYRDLGPWFPLVRQVRNSPLFAPALFDAINGRAGS